MAANRLTVWIQRNLRQDSPGLLWLLFALLLTASVVTLLLVWQLTSPSTPAGSHTVPNLQQQDLSDPALSTKAGSTTGNSQATDDSIAQNVSQQEGATSMTVTNDPTSHTQTTNNSTQLPTDILATPDRLPYPVLWPAEKPSIPGNETDCLTPAVIHYKKRAGGKYIYSNNPEKLADDDINQAILQNKGLTGQCEFTFEHSNYSSKDFYLGYQLKNNTASDARVTVENIGLQVSGEWLGQQSWSDFFGLSFALPHDYFTPTGAASWIYQGVDFIRYTPKPFQPVSYRLRPGEYIWVLGGTSEDAAGNANVGQTANKPLLRGRCANGVVKFQITTGRLDGTFYVYNNPKEAQKSAEQGYITWRNGTDYSKQYKGIDDHLGVIDAHITWKVNDHTKAQLLPVTYPVTYDPYARSGQKTPYRAYQNRTITRNATQWTCALNPQDAHDAVGTDMMTFRCADASGIIRTIDNDHADGGGDPANTGNWMVQYQDSYTLVNGGTKPRTFEIYTQGSLSGALMTLVRDRQGNVLDAQIKAQPYSYDTLPNHATPDHFMRIGNIYWPIVDGLPFPTTAGIRAKVWTVTVLPKSVSQITLEYLNMGNSCGGINHWVQLL